METAASCVDRNVDSFRAGGRCFLSRFGLPVSDGRVPGGRRHLSFGAGTASDGGLARVVPFAGDFLFLCFVPSARNGGCTGNVAGPRCHLNGRS